LSVQHLRLILSPGFGILFGVGRTVCSFSPRSTSPANCGLNILTKEAEQGVASDGHKLSNFFFI
jgi:hypothetical protein